MARLRFKAHNGRRNQHLLVGAPAAPGLARYHYVRASVNAVAPDNAITAQGIQAYRALRSLIGGILAGERPETILTRLPETLDLVLPVDACSVLMFDQRNRRLESLLLAAGQQTTEPALLLSGGLSEGWIEDAIRQGRTLLVGRNAVVEHGTPVTALLVPLPVRRGMPGVLWLARQHGAPFTLAEQSLAETVAALVALIVQGQAMPQPAVAAPRDPATGLYTAEAFAARLATVPRAGGSCALLLVRLGQFKQFTEMFGHRAGARLLREVSYTVRESVRAGDDVFRYRDNELAAIVTPIERIGAATVADRLRRTLAGNDPPLPVAVMIGVALAPDDARDAATLLARATAALDQAKPSGPRRVVYASDLAVAPGALA